MKEVRILLKDDVDLSQIITAAAPYMKALNIQDLDEKPIKAGKITRNCVKGKSTLTAIMDHYTHSAEFTTQSAEGWMAAVGFKRSSASAALSALTKDGHIVKLTKGKFTNHRYRFVKNMENKTDART